LSVPLGMKHADGRPVYPRRIASGGEAPEAVALLTRVLAAQPDQSVVIIQVCFCQLHLAHFDALIWPTLGVSSAPWGLPLPGPAAPGGRRV
jgi:hypothetical protein